MRCYDANDDYTISPKRTESICRRRRAASESLLPDISSTDSVSKVLYDDVMTTFTISPKGAEPLLSVACPSRFHHPSLYSSRQCHGLRSFEQCRDVMTAYRDGRGCQWLGPGKGRNSNSPPPHHRDLDLVILSFIIDFINLKCVARLSPTNFFNTTTMSNDEGEFIYS